jgi:hypothetical protein
MSELKPRQLVLSTLERQNAFADNAVVFGTGAACLQMAGVVPNDVDVLAASGYFYSLWDHPRAGWSKEYNEPALIMPAEDDQTLALNVCRRISEHVEMSYESVMDRGGVRYLDLADGRRIAFEPIEEVLALLAGVGRPQDRGRLASLPAMALQQGLLSGRSATCGMRTLPAP